MNTNTKNIIDEIILLPKVIKNIILNYSNNPISFYILLYTDYTSKSYYIFLDTLQKNNYTISIKKILTLDKEYIDKYILYSYDTLSLKKFITNISTFYNKYINSIHIFILETNNEYILEDALILKKLSIYKNLENIEILMKQMLDIYINIQPNIIL